MKFSERTFLYMIQPLTTISHRELNVKGSHVNTKWLEIFVSPIFTFSRLTGEPRKLNPRNKDSNAHSRFWNVHQQKLDCEIFADSYSHTVKIGSLKISSCTVVTAHLIKIQWSLRRKKVRLWHVKSPSSYFTYKKYSTVVAIILLYIINLLTASFSFGSSCLEPKCTVRA